MQHFESLVFTNNNMSKEIWRSIHLCIYYRRLNAVTHRQIYPIPYSQQLFDYITGSKYFSAFNLSSGYYNSEIEENDKEKQPFRYFRSDQFKFNRSPFGLYGT